MLSLSAKSSVKLGSTSVDAAKSEGRSAERSAEESSWRASSQTDPALFSAALSPVSPESLSPTSSSLESTGPPSLASASPSEPSPLCEASTYSAALPRGKSRAWPLAASATSWSARASPMSGLRLETSNIVAARSAAITTETARTQGFVRNEGSAVSSGGTSPICGERPPPIVDFMPVVSWLAVRFFMIIPKIGSSWSSFVSGSRASSRTLYRASS